MEESIRMLLQATAAATLQAVIRGDLFAKKVLCFTGIILTAYHLKLEFSEDSNLKKMLAELQELAAAEAAKERSN